MLRHSFRIKGGKYSGATVQKIIIAQPVLPIQKNAIFAKIFVFSRFCLFL